MKVFLYYMYIFSVIFLFFAAMTCNGKDNCLHTTILVPLLQYDNVVTGAVGQSVAAFIKGLQDECGLSDEMVNHLIWIVSYVSENCMKKGNTYDNKIFIQFCYCIDACCGQHS